MPPSEAQSTIAPARPAADSHTKPLEELYQSLASGAVGLSRAEAEARLERFGANVLRVRKATPEIVKFLFQFRNFFAMLLIAGGLLAWLAETLDPGQGNLYIAYALLGVVLLNAAFTYVQERQSERIMESFRRMLPVIVTVLRDGDTHDVEAEDLVPGDVIFLSEGDRVPADCRLIEAYRLTVDLSSLTGESEPQELDTAKSDPVPIRSRNMLFSGSLVQSGDAKAIVCRTGMETEIGKIVTLTKATKEVETPIRRELKYFIKIISAIAIFLGVTFFLVSVATGRGELASLIFAIGIIVANVPEGLLPTVTLALTMASKRMASKNALIKNLESVETLGSTTVICSDKTGTLTQNRLSVQTLAIGGTAVEAGDRGLLDHPGFAATRRVMVLCNNAHLTESGAVGDATEGALLMYANEMAHIADLANHKRVAEEPFDYALKRMTTVCAVPPQEGAGATGGVR